MQGRNQGGIVPSRTTPQRQGPELFGRSTHRFAALALLWATKEIGEMLLGVLLTSLQRIELVTATKATHSIDTDFCRLANFCSDSLPLIVLILLNCIGQSLALVLSKLSVVHILIFFFVS
jgi:hypothetical protein